MVLDGFIRDGVWAGSLQNDMVKKKLSERWMALREMGSVKCTISGYIPWHHSGHIVSYHP
jgi:hypothetical protein